MPRPIAFVIALLVFPCASFADNAPDVSRADRGPITRVYGGKIASRVFSNEFAGTRADALKKSGANIPGFDCKGDRLSALIEALPYPVSAQSISWVERYLVDCEPRARIRRAATKAGLPTRARSSPTRMAIRRGRNDGSSIFAVRTPKSKFRLRPLAAPARISTRNW
jgi:hypothetical protein